MPRCARADRVGIVRVRQDAGEVPRVAGVGSWPSDAGFGPQRPRTTNALYRLKDEQWPSAMYYVSISSSMDRQGSHRDYTRFTCPPPIDLRKNWHAHTMTEFWSPFSRSVSRRHAVLNSPRCCAGKRQPGTGHSIARHRYTWRRQLSSITRTNMRFVTSETLSEGG